jgi:hypothetical protein
VTTSPRQRSTRRPLDQQPADQPPADRTASAPRPSSPLAARLAGRWTDLWNGDLAAAQEILAPEFRIWLGGLGAASRGSDALRGPDAMAAFISGFRSQHPGIAYALEAPPLAGAAGEDEPVAGARSGAAVLWTATFLDGSAKSGIDMLHIGDGLILAVWSVTGERAFAWR